MIHVLREDSSSAPVIDELRDLLQRPVEGDRVVEAESVEGARAVLDTESIDAILLDVHLGSDDGLGLLPAIEQDGPAVALLTGSPGVLLPDGATVIGKPFSIDELSDTVRDLVGREGSSLG